MNLPSDIEIKRIVQSAENVQDLFRAYSIYVDVGDGEDSEEELGDITVPIVEMNCSDSEVEEHLSDEGTIAVHPSKADDSCLLESYLKNKSEIYQCKKSRNLLKSSKLKPNVYSCELCGTGFRIKHSITKHRRVVHGLHQFSCMFCSETYPLKRYLLEHIVNHKGPHGFKCSICNKVRPNYVSIQRHVKTHGEKNIICIECDARFKTKWELRSHQLRHQESRHFKCEMCQLTFTNPSKLREHLIKHNGERPYKCDLCYKDFSSQGNLTNHRRLHSEKPYKCQYCSLRFYTNSARKKHIPVHARERKKPYQCEDCSKQYTSTTSLAVHRFKFHSGERLYHCNYCKQKFKSKSAIAEHVADHAAERPFSCQQCMCRYKNRRELRRHQREKEHHDILPVESVENFSNEEDEGEDKPVAEHITAERPFSCQQCVCRYKNRRDLRRHQREKEHYDASTLESFEKDSRENGQRENRSTADGVSGLAPERPFSCQQCACRYKNRRDLRRHQRDKEHYDTLSLESVEKNTADGYYDGGEGEDWAMPEPEVCIREVDDEELIK